MNTLTTAAKIATADLGQDKSAPQSIAPQQCACGATGTCNCLSPATSDSSFVFAIGLLTPFFPRLDLLKEFESATHQLDCKVDDYYRVFTYTIEPNKNEALSYRPFLYIAEQICWVFNINNINTYIVVPRSQLQLNAFIDAQESNGDNHYCALIGALGPVAPPQYCGKLQLPIIICQQLEHPLVNVIEKLTLKTNDGASDVDRAVNFLALNYADIRKGNDNIDSVLRTISYRFSTGLTERIVVEIILAYYDASKSLETFYICGIDVTDQYPFIDFPLRIFAPTG